MESLTAAALLPTLIRSARDGPLAVLDAMREPLLALGFGERRLQGEPTAALWTRGDRPRLAFSGHVDVVPVGEGWTREPFGGETSDGAVWGRGACDMLGAIACYAGAAVAERGASCAILLTTDEETRMHAAERALADGMLEGIEGVVVGEPTRFDIGIAEKGVFWTRIVTRGRNAHGSMPHLGDNAADRLVRVLAEVQRAPLLGQHAMLGPPTLNLGRVAAGEAVNQVPAVASADLDIRYLPGMRDADVKRLLEACADRAGESIEIEVISNHLPFEVAPDDPLVNAARDAVGEGAQVVGLPYGTEASKFAPRGIPCVILGPGDQALAHTNREHIALDALARGEEVYARLLRALS